MVAMFTERKTPCPLSRAALEQKKGSFTCPDITEVYHCLQDERNRSGEICHQPIWVPKDYCPQYNTGGKAITTVTCTSSIGCPDVRFWSNEVYKYPVCLNKTNKNYGGGIPEGKENNPLSPLSEGKESSPVSPWIFVGIAIAVVLAAVCCIVCCIIRRKQKKNKHASELELLPVENEIPLSKKINF
nr:uncharacterized protein LOC109619554 isoform X4 [Crassostrea gigas]